MAEDFEQEVQELDDEELMQVSGGRGKLLCSGGTIRVCGTRDGKYGCRCEPKVPVAAPSDGE